MIAITLTTIFAIFFALVNDHIQFSPDDFNKISTVIIGSITGFLWGFIDGMGSVLCYSILIFEFEEIDTIFLIYHTIRGLIISVCLLLISFIRRNYIDDYGIPDAVLIGFVGIIGIVACILILVYFDFHGNYSGDK